MIWFAYYIITFYGRINDIVIVASRVYSPLRPCSTPLLFGISFVKISLPLLLVL